ncbi:hypothetical protein CDD82_7888 [Ophiocordyceps australis]|uniref:CFEM domain-containing protein n=1 Tax=Ophiocordyceps australis TaxID=1399860 RepID=A0A2C5ZPM7_9HYPO|nr:hypothetical protein CDD82_7888 [Ophiocordyceps australis]
MKSLVLAISLFALAARAALDIAALRQELPSCSLPCIVSSVQGSGCAITDLPCLCVQVEPLLAVLAPCLVKAGCRLENITETAQVLLGVCQREVPDSVHAGSSMGNIKSIAIMVAVPWLGWALILAVTAMTVLPVVVTQD